jgi:acetyl esterase/lipase
MSPSARSQVMNPQGLSPEAEARLVRREAAVGVDLPLPDLDDPAAVRDWRARQHAAWGEDAEPGEIPHVPELIGGVPCLRANPDPMPAGPATVVYLHGGGFGLGSPGTALPITARIGAMLPVVSIDYRLAPEHSFPAALDDLERVVAALSGQGPLVLAGDSAGACLALASCLGEASPTRHQSIAALLLLCPVLDLGTSTDPVVERYVGSAQGSRVSPLSAPDAELGALPPTLLQSTTGDPLHRDALRFVARMQRSGATVRHEVWADLWHAWHYHRELPEARDAVDGACRFVIERIVDGSS